jgi:chloramphenicol O-acetyltransferase
VFLTKNLRKATHFLYFRINNYPAFPVINQILNKNHKTKFNNRNWIPVYVFPYAWTLQKTHDFRLPPQSSDRRSSDIHVMMYYLQHFGTNTWAKFLESRSPGSLKMGNMLRNIPKVRTSHLQKAFTELILLLILPQFALLVVRIFREYFVLIKVYLS